MRAVLVGHAHAIAIGGHVRRCGAAEAGAAVIVWNCNAVHVGQASGAHGRNGQARRGRRRRRCRHWRWWGSDSRATGTAVGAVRADRAETELGASATIVAVRVRGEGAGVGASATSRCRRRRCSRAGRATRSAVDTVGTERARSVHRSSTAVVAHAVAGPGASVGAPATSGRRWGDGRGRRRRWRRNTGAAVTAVGTERARGELGTRAAIVAITIRRVHARLGA